MNCPCTVPLSPPAVLLPYVYAGGGAVAGIVTTEGAAGGALSTAAPITIAGSAADSCLWMWIARDEREEYEFFDDFSCHDLQRPVLLVIYLAQSLVREGGGGCCDDVGPYNERHSPFSLHALDHGDAFRVPRR